MKLIAQIQLKPTPEQGQALLQTMERANDACNAISEEAFAQQSFDRIGLQKAVYHRIKEEFTLSAQITILCVRKVADSYARDQKKVRKFGRRAGIAYDSRVVTYKSDLVSIWTAQGRMKIPYVCGPKQRDLLRHQEGETKLIYRKGKFYLHAVCEVAEGELIDSSEYLGVDLGIVNIATDSEGETFSGEEVEQVRTRHHRLRKRLQKKGTRNARRKLRRHRKKETHFRRSQNHTIAKRIVLKAKGTTRGIALEELKGITKRTTVKKPQRARHMSWAFGQLRFMIEYKAKLHGVPIVLVDPRNTSRTCPQCGTIDKRNRKTRAEFSCISCGCSGHADTIAAENISARASVSTPIAAAVC